jgi:hypothetical protein
MSNDNIKAIECRFAVYCKDNESNQDMHFVKEQIYYKDGTSKPNTRMIVDYKRPFYVTKKGLRNHKSKKEWVNLEEVIKFESTQLNLIRSAAKALGTPWFQGSLRDLSESPYLYGTDILSTCLIKQAYTDKWDTVTAYSNAVFDTETDVLHGTEEIVMATISFKDKVFTAVKKSFVSGYSDVENRVYALAEKYIGDTIKERNIKLKVVFCDHEIDVIRQTVAKAHEWGPDFLSVWNLEFDMDKIIAACDKAGVRVEDILNDPKVPEKFKHFKFKKGAAKKVTASGVVQVFKPAQRWHTVFSPSSFYWIDAMCVYKQIRTGRPEEPSYSLDAILNKHLKISKLKFDEAKDYTGLKWHQFMQDKYPLEYIVYNMFDCISMEMLDEKTLDLQLSLPLFAGSSDFQNFNSQPRRSANALHFYCLENNKVIASTASEMTDEDDVKTASLSDWIVMLPSHLVADNGLQIIKENPNIHSNIRIAVGDLDATASYPTGESVFNISKETTVKELISIEGIDETTKRMGTINLSAGHTNAVEIGTTLFKLPTMDKWLEDFSLN